jgi:trans-aconitate methyltransferase
MDDHHIDHRRHPHRAFRMTAETVPVSTRWLALREPADAAARAGGLVDDLRPHLPATGGLVIHDIGCGTGAMGRWLAPLLPGPQHWVLHDRDSGLLKAAAADLPGPAVDGAAVTAETKESDINRLRSGDLADATLITASALLDMLTADELTRLAGLCMATGHPALLTLSVAGRVDLTPSEALDRLVAAAFDAHQRRATEKGVLLGPDAPAVAVTEFGRRGAEVVVRSSPWRLGASDAGLIAEWFTGWVGAACEQEPTLVSQTDDYRRRRLAQATAGQLQVTVDHVDLLVLPGGPPSRSPR